LGRLKEPEKITWDSPKRPFNEGVINPEKEIVVYLAWSELEDEFPDVFNI
jgi:hypothetical protein